LVKLRVPLIFGHKSVLGYQTDFIRDIKIQVCPYSSDCYDVVTIPTFDYVLYYIVPNAKVKWYQGSEVSYLEPGEAEVCLKLPDLYPDLTLPRTRFALKVAENRALLPDKVVTIKYFYPESFKDFDMCLKFTARDRFYIRGYKLVLDVFEDSYYYVEHALSQIKIR
jgi:hypothetical protein